MSIPTLFFFGGWGGGRGGLLSSHAFFMGRQISGRAFVRTPLFSSIYCFLYCASHEGIGLFLVVDSYNVDRVKRIWYLSPMRAAQVQASLRIRAVSPEPPLLAHTSSESRGTFR